MENLKITRPNKRVFIITSIILILDGLIALFSGVVIYGLLDMADLYTISEHNKALLTGRIILLLCIGYCLFCFVSLFYWKRGMPFWRIFIIILVCLPIAITIYVGAGLFVSDPMVSIILIPLISIPNILVLFLLFSKKERKNNL